MSKAQWFSLGVGVAHPLTGRDVSALLAVVLQNSLFKYYKKIRQTLVMGTLALKGIGMKLLVKILLLAISLVTISACSADRVAIVSDSNVRVYGTEKDAARQSSKNMSPSSPKAVLDKGTKIEVIDDIYGKDYWACEIRHSNQEIGWVLCTSLTFQNNA